MSAEPLAPLADADRRERKLWLLALIVAGLVAALLRTRAVEVGLLSDDYMQAAMIAGRYPGEHYAPFDLYAFVRAGVDLSVYIDKGVVPWFAEPGFHGSVFRPLSSLFLWLDHVLAPGSPRLWHVHSLAWLAALVVSFGLCVRRLLPRWPAALAVALLVCDGGFVSPVGWLANRCVLIAVTFGFLAVYVHLEWRRPTPGTRPWLRRHGPLVELALLAASLAGGEYALGVIAYLFTWELLSGGRRGSTPGDPWPTRARALVPATVAVVGYLALHQLLGYGTSGADVYADPIHNTRGWLEWTAFRIPKLCMGALWSVPAETISVFEHPAATWWIERWPVANAYESHFAHRRYSLLGIGLAAVALVLARAGLDDDERVTLRVVLLGGFLALIPVSVAPAHSRLLVPAQLAACVTVALLCFACVRLIARPTPRSGEGPRPNPTRARARGLALLPFVAALLVLHSYYDLRWSQRYLLHLDGLAEADVLAFTRGDLLDQPLAGREVLVLNGPSQATGMYGEFAMQIMGEPEPASWRSLALGGEYAMYATRPDPRTLELTAIQGRWLETPGELFFRRADQQVPAGTRFDYPGMEVEVLAAAEGRPTRVRFRFPHALDDPRYLFLTATQAGLNRWPVPAVGGHAIVPLPRLPYPEHLIPIELRAGGR